MLLHFLRTRQRAATRARALALLADAAPRQGPGDVAWLREAMDEAGSLDYGRALALDYCERALAVDDRLGQFAGERRHGRFLREMLRYVIERVK